MATQRRKQALSSSSDYTTSGSDTSSTPRPPSSSEKGRKHDGGRNIEDTPSGGLSVLDVLRVLGGILVLSCSMSYLATGESLTWGWNPWYLRPHEWKAIIQGEVRLTDDQLLKYDGTDPNLPIYLALNGTIYDVSENRRTYGPGGSYNHFAGHDSARAFITGCFMEDQTPDLRGVEEMFVPIEPEEKEAMERGAGPHPQPQPKQTYDPDTHQMRDADPAADPNSDVEKRKKARANDKRRSKLSKAQLKTRREKEYRQARKQVAATLEGWHKLFRGDKGKKYFRVGTVVREPGWLEKLPRRQLCDHARNSRPVRKEEGDEEKED